MTDKIIEDLRRVREEYARKFNYDLDAMVEDLRRKERLSGARVVTLPKRPPVFIPAPKEQTDSAQP